MSIIGLRATPQQLPDQRQPPPRDSWTTFFLRPTGVRTVNQALETDTAFSITPVPSSGPPTPIPVGKALESNIARPMTAAKGVAAPPAVAQRVALARYTLEVSWEAHAEGAFVIGTSTVGGTDTLALSPFDVTFTGTYDNLSAMFRGATIRRGRDDLRTFLVRGEARISVRDVTGLLNPENAAGPLYGILSSHYQRVRLRGFAPSGAMHPLFYGFLDRIEWNPLRRDSGAGSAVLVCKDLLLWLSEARPIIAATGTTTTGAAIGKVLDALGLIDPAGRSLATGDTIFDFSADGSKTGLELIGELLQAERGTFFVDAAGVAVYEDRISRTLRESSAVISHQMSSAVPAIDHSRARNRVRVKRTQTGYVATSIDQASRTVIGDRDLEDIETPYLSADTQADALASFILAELGSPREPLRDVEIDNRTEALLVQCLARELGDVVTVAAAGAEIALSDYVIESLEHRIDPRRHSHSIRWQLSKHEIITPFRIGTSVIVAEGAQGDVLVY
ncbi:MAG TPA: hypothetical protein VI540_09010 [Gaiellaceae bacterium]|nr:hypothetical protein [Gaiellaceae bacterium]